MNNDFNQNPVTNTPNPINQPVTGPQPAPSAQPPIYPQPNKFPLFDKTWINYYKTMLPESDVKTLRYIFDLGLINLISLLSLIGRSGVSAPNIIATIIVLVLIILPVYKFTTKLSLPELAKWLKIATVALFLGVVEGIIYITTSAIALGKLNDIKNYLGFDILNVSGLRTEAIVKLVFGVLKMAVFGYLAYRALKTLKNKSSIQPQSAQPQYQQPVPQPAQQYQAQPPVQQNQPYVAPPIQPQPTPISNPQPVAPIPQPQYPQPPEQPVMPVQAQPVDPQQPQQYNQQ